VLLELYESEKNRQQSGSPQIRFAQGTQVCS
jgi:hypothetical protein